MSTTPSADQASASLAVLGDWSSPLLFRVVVCCVVGSFPFGCSSVSFLLHSIGVKDAEGYVNPFISIVVTSPTGPVVEVQDTPFLTLSDSIDRHLTIDQTVHLHTTVDRIRTEGLSVFFELRHWKGGKKKVSVRCFALLELTELEEAARRDRVALEVYKKPTDWNKKRLNLLSIKPLYLNLSCTITQH
jgi:hypothetical protein